MTPLHPAAGDNSPHTAPYKPARDTPSHDFTRQPSSDTNKPTHPMNPDNRRGLFGSNKTGSSSPQKPGPSYVTPPRKTYQGQGHSHSPSLQEKLGEIVKGCLDNSSSPQRAANRPIMTSPRPPGAQPGADGDASAIERLSALSVEDNRNLKDSKSDDLTNVPSSDSRYKPTLTTDMDYDAPQSAEDELDPVLERLTLERPSELKQTARVEVPRMSLEMILREQDLLRAQSAEREKTQSGPPSPVTEDTSGDTGEKDKQQSQI